MIIEKPNGKPYLKLRYEQEDLFTDRSPTVKPFLKWMGGKRQLLPKIRLYLPKNLNELKYYEPFVGAGALFFYCQPRTAVINDMNEQLILSYKVIKEHVDELIELLHTYKENDNKDFFYQIRGQDRNPETFSKLTDIQKAARLIYLTKSGFNGLYKVNSQGCFNTPYGLKSGINIDDDITLKAVSKYLNREDVNVSFLNKDFSIVVQGADKNSFVYFDPPYHNTCTGYTANRFNEDDQRRLRDVFIELTNVGAKCLLSNSDTPFIQDLYKDFEINIVEVYRGICADATKRRKVNEVLVRNWT